MSLREISRQKFGSNNKYNGYTSSINKITSEITNFDLKRKSKSNTKQTNKDSNVVNFDINSYLGKNEKTGKKPLKYDIDALFNGTEKENSKSNKYNKNKSIRSMHSYLSNNAKSRTISNSINSTLIDFSSGKDKQTCNTSISYLKTSNKTPKNKIFREINSYSY